MAADDEIALRRDRTIDREQSDPREKIRARDVTGGGFRELGAPEFSARFAGDDGVVVPPIRPEAPASRRGAVEAEAAGALVLRRVVEDAGLIDHVRQPARMPRRKAVVPARFEAEKFVERVAIRHPGRAFLIRGEKIAEPVEL